MIDLRNRRLPSTVCVNGKPFSIYTDFRVWLEFGERIKRKDVSYSDLFFVFKNEVPQTDFAVELMDFYSNPNATPKGVGSEVEVLDYILDGEYIFGSFMAEYGIDLVEVEELHWHKFKALFLSLSEDSKIGKIMSYRGYTKSNKTMEQSYIDIRASWALPVELSEEEQERLDWFDSL